MFLSLVFSLPSPLSKINKYHLFKMLKYVEIWLHAYPSEAYRKNPGMVSFTHSFLNSLKQHMLYFLDYKMHFQHPPNLGGNGGGSYSPNVAYLTRYRISALKDVIKYFTTFCASKIFFLFSSSKT